MIMVHLKGKETGEITIAESYLVFCAVSGTAACNWFSMHPAMHKK